MEWISVKDKLPPMNMFVLCINPKRSKRYFIGSYIGAKYASGYAAFKHAEKDMAVGATHWMPLPDPPKFTDYS